MTWSLHENSGRWCAAARRDKTRRARTEHRPARVIWCYATMLSRYEITEGLLIAVLGAHLVLLFFIAWQFTRFGRTHGLFFRRARRLAIAMRAGTVMDCDEHIDQLLSAETARTGDADHVAASAGGTAATPDVSSPAAEQREEPDTHVVQNGRNWCRGTANASRHWKRGWG